MTTMSVPLMTHNAGIYSFQWPDEGIRIVLDRIDDSRHTTTGEALVLYRAPETDDFQHLHLSRLNLTSTTARTTLARHLTERRKEVDWAGVLEQACVLTLRKHREGEPLTWIGNLPVETAAKYMVHPLLLASQPNLIFGLGGSGKSTLAAMLGLQVASKGQGAILVLDYEWDRAENNALYKGLKAGMALDPGIEVAYRFCSGPLPDDILSIQRAALETQATLVVVDSAGAACGGDPQDPDVVLRYFNALRSLRVTTLTLAHTAKENRGPFGSVYWTNCSRNLWETVKGSGEEGCLTVALHHRKMNSGPLLKPLGYKFSYSFGDITPQKVDAKQIPEALASMAVVDQMEAAILDNGPMAPAELAEVLGKTASHMSKELSRHRNRFTPVGNGKWAMKAREGLTP